MATKNFIGNDTVEMIVTNAASAMADEIFAQRGDKEFVEYRGNAWYGVQAKLREGFLDVTHNVANGEDYPKSDPRTYSVADLLKMDYTTKEHILKEMHQCISEGKEYELISPYYVHFIDGEVCVQLVCTHVGVNADDELYFKTESETGRDKDCDKGETLYMYDAISLANLLGAVEQTVRVERINRIRTWLYEIGLRNGGNSHFIPDDMPDIPCGKGHIVALTIAEGGDVLAAIQIGDDDPYNVSLSDKDICDGDITRLEQYIEEQKKRTIKVRMTASRVFEVLADNPKDAIEKAKEQLIATPLYDGDIDDFEVM